MLSFEFFFFTFTTQKDAHMGNVEMVVITGSDLRLAAQSVFPTKT